MGLCSHSFQSGLVGTYDNSIPLGDGLVQIFLKDVEGVSHINPEIAKLFPLYFAVLENRFDQLRLNVGDVISAVVREEIDHSIGGFMQSERYTRIGGMRVVQENNVIDLASARKARCVLR
jgi:hypothetical protein